LRKPEQDSCRIDTNAIASRFFFGSKLISSALSFRQTQQLCPICVYVFSVDLLFYLFIRSLIIRIFTAKKEESEKDVWMVELFKYFQQVRKVGRAIK
jgi:hypothetical protein